MLNIGMSMDIPWCPCLHLWLPYPKYLPQPWPQLSHLICFWLWAVLTLPPSLSSLCSLLNCVFVLQTGFCSPQVAAGKVLWEVYSVIIEFSLQYLSFHCCVQKLCLDPFQGVSSQQTGQVWSMDALGMAWTAKAVCLLSKIAPCLGSTDCCFSMLPPQNTL